MAVEAVLPAIPPSAVSTTPAQSVQGPGAGDFERRLEAAIHSASDTQNAADVRLGRLASGEEADIHSTMIALQEADISMRMMVSARDKVVEAYQTMMSIAI